MLHGGGGRRAARQGAARRGAARQGCRGYVCGKDIDMTVNKLCGLLPLTALNNEEDRDVTGVFCCDLLSVAMAKAPEGAAWVTVIGNANTIAVATLADVACIILAEGYTFDEAAVSAAKGKIALFMSDKPAYETAVSIGELL